MPISGYGFSNLNATVSLNLARAQGQLQSDVARLSSGLRINSAADDPSGLSIADRLQSKVNGYDQAASNIQDANNALAVADGALQTVTDILERLRSLAVSANDDLVSTSDRAHLQTEVDQLQREINSIAETTYFNGVSLFNGDTKFLSAGPLLANQTFQTPFVGNPNSPSSYAYDPAGTSWVFSGFAGITGYGSHNSFTIDNYVNSTTTPSGSTQVAFLQGQNSTISQTIAGLSAGQQYAIAFNTAQRGQGPLQSTGLQSFGVTVDGQTVGTYQPIPTDPAHPNWISVTTAIFGISAAGTHTISLQGENPVGDTTVFIDDVHIIKITQNKDFHIQDGADEGDIVDCVVPGASTSYLGISLSSVMSTASAAFAENAIDEALQALNSGRTILGAQMVRLQEQASNDETASVNLTGSESTIRDLNVAQATTAFAAEQILASIGTSILANVKTFAASVEKLFA